MGLASSSTVSHDDITYALEHVKCPLADARSP